MPGVQLLEKSNPTSSASTDSEDQETSKEIENLPNGLPPVNAKTGRTLGKAHKSKIIRRVLRAAELKKNLTPQSQSSLKAKDVRNAGSVFSQDVPSLFRQLAISHGGLIKDEYRRKIWPKLAEFHGRLSSDTPVPPLEEPSDDEMSMVSSSTLSVETTSPTPEKGKDGSMLLSPSSTIENGSGEANDTFDSDKIRSIVGEFEELKLSDEDLRTHKEWRQVEMDVHRTLARFPPNISDLKRQDLQSQLTPLIVRLIWDNPSFQYYQGFHDICLTFLLTLGYDSAYRVSETLSTLGVFPFLTEPMETIEQTLKLIYVIIRQVDPDLDDFLRGAQLGCTFALSWYITWFAHVIDSYDQVVRLYDLFLASHPLMPIYLSAALVLYRSDDLMRECDCDMAEVHSFLSKTPSNLPYEALISDAQDLFIAYPPRALQGRLQIDYENHLQIQQERVKHGKLKRSMSWHMGTPRTVHRKEQNFSVTFWAVTATAAAWYLYTHSQTLAHWLG